MHHHPAEDFTNHSDHSILNKAIKVSHWQKDITFTNSFGWQDYLLYIKTEQKTASISPVICVSIQTIFTREDARSVPFQLTDGWCEQMLRDVKVLPFARHVREVENRPICLSLLSSLYLHATSDALLEFRHVCVHHCWYMQGGKRNREQSDRLLTPNPHLCHQASGDIELLCIYWKCLALCCMFSHVYWLNNNEYRWLF